MSMVPTGPDGLEHFETVDGLEDFDPSDLGVPVIRIDGKKEPRAWLEAGYTGPAFVDSVSGQEWPSLDGIIMLGLVKGRVLWPAQMGDGKDVPLCRSFDSKEGYPTAGKFPWGAVPHFERDTLKIGEKEGDEPGSIVTLYKAPCEQCTLKDWGSHPAKDAPWCTLQHSYPVLIPAGNVYVPSILVLQRSSIKPSTNYAGGFHRARQPMYTVQSSITLDPRRKGQTDYAIPVIRRGVATPEADYRYFSETFHEIAAYLRTPRGLDDAAQDDEVTAEGAPTTDPQPVPHPAETPVAAPSAPVAQASAPPTPTAPTAAPQQPAPTPPPSSSEGTVAPPSPAATAPASPDAAAKAAPSEPAAPVAQTPPPAPVQPPPPPAPVWDEAAQAWLSPVWNGTGWDMPSPAPAAPVAQPATAAPVEVDDVFASAPAPAPAAPPAAPAPAAPPASPAPAAAADDDEIPF